MSRYNSFYKLGFRPRTEVLIDTPNLLTAVRSWGNPKTALPPLCLLTPAFFCQLNVKPLSKRDIEFIYLPLLTALPHPTLTLPVCIGYGVHTSLKLFKNLGFTHPNHCLNSINDYPNSINDYPNSINDYPNSINDYPNSMNDYPNSINDHPNSMNDYPNSINDHPNSIYLLHKFSKPHLKPDLLRF